MIVDTNALSAFFDGAPGALQAFDAADEIAVPVIVLGEYRFGLLGSRKRRAREAVLEQLTRSARVLEVTDATSRHYAAIRHDLRAAGRPIPVNDTWIAALAREHSLPVLSNDAHFDAVRDVRRTAWRPTR